MSSNSGFTFDSFPKLQILEDGASLYVILNDKDYHISLGDLKNMMMNAIPALQIPEDVVRLDLLQSQLEEYIKGIDAQVLFQSMIDASPANQLVGKVVEKDELEARVLELSIILQLSEKLRTLEGQSFITSAELSKAFMEFEPRLPLDLVRQEVVSQIDNRVRAIEELQPSDFVKKGRVELIETRMGVFENRQYVSLQELNDALQAIEKPSGEDAYVTLASFNNLKTNVTNLENRDVAYEQRFEELRQAIPELPSNMVLKPALDDTNARIARIEQLNPVAETRVEELLAALPIHKDAVSKSQHEGDLNLKLSAPANAVAATVLSYTDDGLVQVAMRNNSVFYVSKDSTSNVENGSFFQPFKTIQAAINAAPSVSVIILAPGAYTEDLVVTKDNILIQGYGCVDAIITQIVGKITIGGEARPTTTRFRTKDVSMKNKAVGEPCLVFLDNAGRHYFNNLTIEPINGTTVPLVQFIGKQSNWIDFTTCNIGGEILLDGEPVNFPQVYFTANGHYGTVINIQKDYNVSVNTTKRLRKIIHAAGHIRLRYVDGFGGINGIGLESTSDTGSIDIGFTSFLTLTGGFARINKTGACPINFFLTHRDEVNDVITSP